MMTQGIEINGIHTYRDLDLYIAERTITPGAKKEIKKEVPFMNGAYDFSAMNGEVTYSEAELKYVFDIAELTTAEMEQKKNEVEDWFFSAVDAEIRDDYSPGYYYKGNASAIEWEEDFGQGHITLIFKAYPYKFSAEDISVRILSGMTAIRNTSSHAVSFALKSSEAMSMTLNGKTYSLSVGNMDTTGIKLKSGNNDIKLIGTNGYVDITYQEERFC